MFMQYSDLITVLFKIHDIFSYDKRVYICYKIKGNESNVGNTDFELQA